MIIHYKFGFVFEGKLYGWKDKRLYKLPQEVNGRFYGLLECKKWKRNGKELGYFLGDKAKSTSQLLSMTHFIDKKIDVINDDDVPF